MIEDKERWNIRHVEKPMPHYVAPTLEKYIKEANIGRGLWNGKKYPLFG